MRDKAIPEKRWQCDECNEFGEADSLREASNGWWVCPGCQNIDCEYGQTLSDYLKERYVQMPRELGGYDWRGIDRHIEGGMDCGVVEAVYEAAVKHFSEGGAK